MNTSKESSPFEAFATEYDSWYDSQEGKVLYENELRCIKELINDCEEVLEVGVGTGRFLFSVNRAFGVDIAFAPLKIARSKGLSVIQAKAEELPFKDKIFSCCLFVVALCFIKDAVKALLEAKRVLKENGKIIICDVFKDSEWGKFYEEKKTRRHPFYSHANFYEFAEFKKILTDCGLSIKKVFGTLKKSPFEASELENPEEIKDFNQLPGFVCIEAVK